MLYLPNIFYRIYKDFLKYSNAFVKLPWRLYTTPILLKEVATSTLSLPRMFYLIYKDLV